ncbi:unnamed protein product [Porites evermanni]|uniref:BTB domain-containing protein n=1 Tax=Porites evermanni TaxID=104178 RepID=A0ABN8LYJ0_9CNID|nr:unnamed protein product [Porites evermanni]
MMKLTEKCENYLILRLEKENTQFQLPRQNLFDLPKDKCLELLNIGQNYGLDRLQSACIELAMRIKFQKLTTDTNYKNISVSNRERILEEEERFHVHRCILGMWSEVFSTMFTSLFKEKTDEEVPLPGKKSAEIKEMLLVIYPTSAKPIDGSNYAFLLDLAKEYMMTKVTEKCEKYLIDRLGSAISFQGRCKCGNKRNYVRKEDCLDLLVIAQNYGLDRLETACIERAKKIQFAELKNDTNFDKICASNYRKIVEGMLL